MGAAPEARVSRLSSLSVPPRPESRRPDLGRAPLPTGAGAQVSLIVWGWALALYPYIVPPALTIAGAAAPEVTLTLVLWAVAGGALALFPSLVYLFRIFKR